MKGYIELTGMKFHAPVGCLRKEKAEGNDIVVDFRCSYDISAAAASDRLEDTLDYSEIYRITEKEVCRPANLLENVAGRIAAAIEEKHPELEHFTLKVSKKNPPVEGEAEYSAVELEK